MMHFISCLQLDAAAPILAKLDHPIVVAKINADKYSKLASKYEIEYVDIYLFFHLNFTCYSFL